MTSRNIIIVFITAVLMASVAFADKVDPRVRTYIDPVRVVWFSKSTQGYGTRMQVARTERLLEKHYGQVPEYGVGTRPSACCLQKNLKRLSESRVGITN